MYIQKSKEPKMEPWGTPAFILAQLDETELCISFWLSTGQVAPIM